jgi:hypothetical protein
MATEAPAMPAAAGSMSRIREFITWAPEVAEIERKAAIKAILKYIVFIGI